MYYYNQVYSVEYPSYNQELYHHGIKGMKWGIRKQIETLGRRLRGENDIVLKKGTKFQRIATASNSGFTQGVYTSYKQADKDLYKGVLGRMRVSGLLKQHGEVKLQEITMHAGKDIRMPSKKTRMDEFEALYKSDPKGVAALINEHETSRYGRKATDYTDDYFRKNIKTEYQKFNDALSMGVNSQNGHVIQKYYNNLQKKGYDAIPDENDIRLSTFKAQAPIIMFDTSKSIGSTTSRELSASEVFSAYNRSIGAKTVRDLLYRGNIGFERLTNDSESSQKKYQEQLNKDKNTLSSKYTMDHLAEDWGRNRLSSNQIKKVNSLMEQGASHDEAVRNVKTFGNTILDRILSRYKL